MPPEGWNNVRRLLAVRLDNIGDMIMLGPSLRALRANLPGRHITVLASPAGSQACPLLPWVDDVIVRRAVWQDAFGAMPLDPVREQALIETLRQGDFDAAVIFTSFSQSPFPPAYACYLAGIPIRLGQSKEFGGSLLSATAPAPPDEWHGVDRNLNLLEFAGLRPAGRDLEIVIPDSVQAESDLLLRKEGVEPLDPFIVLAPGASCAARTYDAGRFTQAMERLVRATGLPLVVAGAERERDLAASILAGLPGLPVHSLAGRTTVPALAAVLKRGCLIIANDSGPMHIADALGRPMVILFSGTELEQQWRPRSAPSVLLRRLTDCTPCYQFRCPYQMECLDIPPDDVAEAAMRLLARTGGAGQRVQVA